MTEKKSIVGAKIDDVIGVGKIGKQIIKLLEKVGFSYWKKDLAMRDFDAQAYGIEVLAKAEANALKIKVDAVKENLPGMTISSVTKGNLTLKAQASNLSLPPSPPIAGTNYSQAEIRERNAASVVFTAASSFQNEEIQEDNEVNTDWFARFIRAAEDISDKEMQFLWASVLAGEIKSPGRFSLRTLDVLRNLSKNEAEIFTRIGKYIVIQDNIGYIFNFVNGFTKKISDIEILSLRDAGLLTPSEIRYTLNDPFGKTLIWRNGDLELVGYNTQTNGQGVIYTLEHLSNAGLELLTLLPVETDSDYLEEICDCFLTDGYNMIIRRIGEAEIIYPV